MVYRLPQKEFEQLKLIKRGLLTNESLPHDRVAIGSLIEKDLLRPNGVAVRLTPEGQELLDGSREYEIID